FEISLNTITQNFAFNDTTPVVYTDPIALGDIDDPEFGHTHANFNFSIAPATLGTYPFVNRDSLSIDSVVLQMGYIAAFGDTVNNGIQTVHVFEIDPAAGFNDTTRYRYADPATEFATTGLELGSASYSVRSLKDSLHLVRGKDTAVVSNVLRVRLDNELAARFAAYDTSNGYKNDSLFHQLFRGLSLQSDAGGNALTYFDLSNTTNTKLTVYFRYGLHDTTSFDFFHTGVYGVANYVNRQPSGNYLTYLGNGATDQIYLQSAPGSYVKVVIPALDTFGNKVIHRAEIVGTKIPSAADDVFGAPSQLMLDRKNRNTPDTVFMLQNDLVASASGTIGFTAFGGSLLSDNAVRFNVSQYVQGIITKHQPNDTLRLFAPFRTNEFNSALNTTLSLRVTDAIAKGRLVLGGGTYPDPTKRLRLRIIYSNL
ncbi:MAG TPA: DUF4270 family protein, partial [Chitinophagaceae bacterium]